MKTILLKVSGEVLSEKNASVLPTLVEQIKTLTQSVRLGIVLGGGNFFRGDQNGKTFGLRPTTAHTVGMIATIMNGQILYDILIQNGIACVVLSALHCPRVTQPIRQEIIDHALNKNMCIIFVGGTGNPFVTTDTNAVIRALQIDADHLWKGTKVDGIYDADPKQHASAQKFGTITYKQVLDKKLGVIDTTAVTLAQQHTLPIRVFNIFEKNALVQALEKADFGSTIRK